LAILSVSLTAGALASTALGSGMQHAPAAEAAPPKSTDQTVPRYLGAIPDSKSANRVSRSVTRNDQPDQVLSLQLKPVEQGIADRGPLDGGLRSIDLGLQLPSGYRQCFERPGGGFMRADGGLVAMFHQSIYVQTREGLLPDIPASTIFVIGGVPLAAEIGHGRLLPVDPLDPGRGPSAAEVFAPRVAPDEAWVVSATPGDRIRRFGYGPGYRVAASARPDPVVEVEHHLVEPRDAGESIALRAGDSNRNTSRLQSRFFEDSSYRRDRMRSLAASCTEAIAPRRLRSSEPSTTEASESDRSRSAPAQHPKP
jgi:hypothetical protein